MRSPWGKVQSKKNYGLGVDSVETASHGGFKLDRYQNARIPKIFRSPGGWYEEDCEAYIVIYFLNEYFPKCDRTRAEEAIKSWMWEKWEKHTGQELLPGESRLKDRFLWEKANEDNFVTSAAWGDWHGRVPKGMVAVCAVRRATNEEKYFLMPKEEYSPPTVIHQGQYEEIAPI